MTDLLPPPPGEILLDPPIYGEAEYEAQGGGQHPFWFSFGNRNNPMYQKGNVSGYEFNRSQINSLNGMVEEFTTSLREALAQDEISADVAQTFADIFDISLKRSYEFTVNVEYTFTVELDSEDDPDGVVGNLNFEVSDGYGSIYNLDNVDFSISNSDYTEV